MSKKVLGDMPFFEEEGDIIDRVTREHEYLEEQKRKNIHHGVTEGTEKEKKREKEKDGKKSLKLLVSELEKDTKKDGGKKGNDMKQSVSVIPFLNRRTDTPADAPGNSGTEAEPGVVSVSLNDVALEYHRRLLKNRKALSCLKQRGITDQSMFTDYQLGFSDGTLKEILSADQVDCLKEQGLFCENGTEFFADCLVFPIFDENKKVVSFYGWTIDDHAKVKDLYLKGPHRSVFNLGAVKVYREQIVLTESVLDALSLIRLDIRGTLACYGVNGFTEEMSGILKKERVKEVVIAFDNDDAGQTGAAKLRDKLTGQGFAVKCICPPVKKDWNEELVRGITKEQIQALIEEAECYQEQKQEKLSFEIKGDTYYFRKDGLTYRVIGFKGNFTTELKLNLRCWQDKDREKTLSRVFNIYAERACELYIRAVSEEFSISQDIIKGHFEGMIEVFEEERERLLDEKGKKFAKKIYVLSNDEAKQALDILTGSDLLQEHLLADTEKMGLVGEEANKIICYHAIISRLWRRPVNVCTLSMYGMGKSFLHDTMHRFVPEEDLKDYSRITKNDLYYREDENAFMGKILSVDEVEGIADSLYSIRTLISKGYLSVSYASVDPVTGKMGHEENKVFGRPSVFVTGTNDEKMDEETLSRFVVCTTDASNDQRLRIKQRQFFEMSMRGMKERRMEEELVKKHRNILRMIKKMEVLFPASWDLSRIENGDYSPRNNLCYLSFIASSAIRDQHNRKIYTGDDAYGRFSYIEASKADVRLANRIMLELFGKSVRDLKPPQKIFLEKVQAFVREQVRGKNLAVTEYPFYEMDVRLSTGLSASQVSCYLNDLIRLEYIVLDGRGRHNKKRYKLAIDEIKDESERYLSGLIDADRL
jgi:DNA primase